jgi:ribosomal protein L37AE/L43A
MNTRVNNNSCPCCGDTILRHARHGEIYWFCSSCHQEVPSLISLVAHSRDNLTLKSRPLTAVNS